MGVGIFISSCHCTHSKVYLKFHGVGFLISSYKIVHIQGQFEIPWGWDLDIFLPLYTFKVNLNFMGFPRVGMRSYRQGVRSCATRRPALHKRSCAIRGVAYLQSGWYRIAVGRHTMSSKGARSSVNVECGLRWK